MTLIHREQIRLQEEIQKQINQEAFINKRKTFSLKKKTVVEVDIIFHPYQGTFLSHALSTNNQEWTKSDAMIAVGPLTDEVLMPYSEN